MELTVQEQRRGTILDLEQALLEHEQVDLPVVHYFANGVYGREMFIPAGVTLVGKIHRYSCITVLSEGEILVATEFGSDAHKAPDTWVSVPGSKRAIYAVKDSTIVTFHPCESEDLEQIEQDLIAPSYDNLLEAK